MRLILSVDALMPPLTGIGRYVYELAYGLKNYPEINPTYTALGNFLDDPGYYLNTRHPIKYLRRFVPFRSRSRKLYYGFKNYRLCKRLNLMRDYLYHGPNYTLPNNLSGRSVTTIHDLSHIHYANFHPADRVDFLNKELPKAIKQSSHIITVSDYIRTELINMMGIEPNKISTVYLGVDKTYHPRHSDELTPVLNKYGLQEKNYILAVATLEPRKNLSRLIQAYLALSESTRQQFPLVFIGIKGWLNEELLKLSRPLETKGQLYRLGYVPEADLPYLYAGARVFTFPSLYEGFGLPVLEAMASGIPVLTSKNSAMAEIVQDNAVLVEPLDVQAISTGIAQLLFDEKLAEHFVQKGLQRAAEFSWSNCVAKTVRVYQKVMTE